MELVIVPKRRHFLDNHLARLPVTTNQGATMKVKDKVLSSVGAQDMDTSGYQVSANPDDVEFYWDKVRLDVHAVFIPGIDNPFLTKRV